MLIPFNNSSFFKYTKGITGVSNYDSVDYILNVRKKSIVVAFILYLPFTLVSLKTMGIRIFLKNQILMRQISESKGARHILIIQPMYGLHEKTNNLNFFSLNKMLVSHFFGDLGLK